MKKKILAIISILLISLSAGLAYMTHFNSSTGLDRKEEKIIKHGFRLLEEQIGIYIKENYSGISKIEFSPIFIQGGKDNPPFTADVLPVIYDEEGNRAVLGGQIGKTGYPSFVLMNMRFAAPRDKSVFETLPLEALEFSLQNKLKKVR